MLGYYFIAVVCFVAGVLFKPFVIDKIKAYVVVKLTPGIIHDYLEGMLGINQKQSLPPVQVVPLNFSSKANEHVEASLGLSNIVPATNVVPEVVSSSVDAPIALPEAVAAAIQANESSVAAIATPVE